MNISYSTIIKMLNSRPDVFGDVDSALRNILLNWFRDDEWWTSRFPEGPVSMSDRSYNHETWDFYVEHLDFMASDINYNNIGIYIGPASGSFQLDDLPPFNDLLKDFNKKGTRDPRSLIVIFPGEVSDEVLAYIKEDPRIEVFTFGFLENWNDDWGQYVEDQYRVDLNNIISQLENSEDRLNIESNDIEELRRFELQRKLESENQQAADQRRTEAERERNRSAVTAIQRDRQRQEQIQLETEREIHSQQDSGTYPIPNRLDWENLWVKFGFAIGNAFGMILRNLRSLLIFFSSTTIRKVIGVVILIMLISTVIGWCFPTEIDTEVEMDQDASEEVLHMSPPATPADQAIPPISQNSTDGSLPTTAANEYIRIQDRYSDSFQIVGRALNPYGVAVPKDWPIGIEVNGVLMGWTSTDQDGWFKTVIDYPKIPPRIQDTTTIDYFGLDGSVQILPFDVIGFVIGEYVGSGYWTTTWDSSCGESGAREYCGQGLVARSNSGGYFDWRTDSNTLYIEVTENLLEPTNYPVASLMPDATLIPNEILQAMPEPTLIPAPTSTPRPTVTPIPTSTPRPTVTPVPTMDYSCTSSTNGLKCICKFGKWTDCSVPTPIPSPTPVILDYQGMITLTSRTSQIGDIIDVAGIYFAPNDWVSYYYSMPGEKIYLGSSLTDSSGTFNTTVRIPWHATQPSANEIVFESSYATQRASHNVAASKVQLSQGEAARGDAVQVIVTGMTSDSLVTSVSLSGYSVTPSPLPITDSFGNAVFDVVVPTHNIVSGLLLVRVAGEKQSAYLNILE